ncbi:MAG: Spy/CpxP family protein refolding chaperone [bacterium]|nr:Spy/CpxP family protein refolding chaperone [bacterium]
MKNKILLILLIVSLALNLGILFKVLKNKPAGSGSGHHKETCGSWKSCSSCLDLKLSPRQIEQLESLHSAFKTDLQPLKAQIKEERHKLLELLKKDSLDEQGTHLHITHIAQFQTGIQERFVRYFFDVKALLAPSQREKFFFYFHDEMCGKGTGLCISCRKKHGGAGTCDDKKASPSHQPCNDSHKEKHDMNKSPHHKGSGSKVGTGEPPSDSEKDSSKSGGGHVHRSRPDSHHHPGTSSRTTTNIISSITHELRQINFNT